MSERLRDALSTMAKMYPSATVSPDMLRMYESILSEYPEPAVIVAMRVAVKTSRFMPTVADIIDAMAESSISETADDAWTVVMSAISRHGRSRPVWDSATGTMQMSGVPTFENALTTRVVESLGWNNLCNNDAMEMRDRFIYAYRELSRAQKTSVRRGEIDTTPAIGEPTRVDSPRAISDIVRRAYDRGE